LYGAPSVNVYHTRLLPYIHSNSQLLSLRLNCSLMSALRRSCGNIEPWSLCSVWRFWLWPPSLPRDRTWPRVTKCMHSRVVGLRLEGRLVLMASVCVCLSVNLCRIWKKLQVGNWCNYGETSRLEVMRFVWPFGLDLWPW